jgi:hypothetical protein
LKKNNPALDSFRKHRRTQARVAAEQRHTETAVSPVENKFEEAAGSEKELLSKLLSEPIEHQLIDDSDDRKKIEEINLLEQKVELMDGLPHLYGWKFYPWAREFFESRNKMNFLCAANQISKSSTQIRKAIHWATDKSLWEELWSRTPSQFWYLYPSQEVVNIEFELKWVREFLPRGKYKDDPVYGWTVIKERKDIRGIKFNSGVHLYFKTYTKDVQHLQTGTCYAIFADEELPENLYSELQARLTASNGYFHMVFTATIGQNLWRLTMEPRAREEEKFPQAAKWTVSLYEAKYYEDGTPSFWNDERISQIRASCKSHSEVLKRVYGRFIMLEGRRYPTFDSTRHMVPITPIPDNWYVYSGVDIGSGGETGHPSAITFIAVRPDFRAGKIFMGWRGDKQQTTDSDVVLKYIEMKKESGKRITSQYYDFASKDFFTIAARMGESFLKADKSHETGDGVINTLFKNDMLEVFETEELGKLAAELSTLKEDENPRRSRNDFSDSFRYAVSSINWDFSGLTGVPSDWGKPKEELTSRQRELQERRKAFDEKSEDELNIESEFEEWNNFYNG